MFFVVSEVGSAGSPTLLLDDRGNDELDEISAEEDSATVAEEVAAEDVIPAPEPESSFSLLEDACRFPIESGMTEDDESGTTDDELFSPPTSPVPFPSSPQATIPTATKARTPSNENLFILHLMRCDNRIAK